MVSIRGITTPIMQNKTENHMEHDMGTGVCTGLVLPTAG